ncbi:TetR/AcrR family transcriptional regulator [Levilactobacillus bambusae]|uniref:HTH tetR-type domain-containing protein n=1 Tax=Levilactobacillus bambusae TaxID=2024736 RepID=A0A2V1MZ38_9LACO|nr:TetR/AcrR family transcriptional regulator [Levilactobacillus bambusae]PWG00281.1 hypothetical protein DCM90_04945 [Levilactobacillus bambusae]
MDEAARRAEMTAKINEYMVVHGFHSLKMDQIAKIMGVSRGKLYLYFSSKTAVVEAVVARYLTYISRLTKAYEIGTASEIIGEFLDYVVDNLLLNTSSSPVFIADLQADYPELAEQLKQAETAWVAEVRQYLLAGQRLGVFNDINPDLIVLSDQAMMPQLTPQYLLGHGLTPLKAIHDLFQYQINSLVRERYRSQIDLTAREADLARLAAKYTQTFE